MSYDFINNMLVILALLLTLAIAGHSQTAAPEAKSAVVLPTSKEIGGAWKLNADESDDAIAKIAVMMATKSDDSQLNSDEKSDLPSITISLFHPDAVILAADSSGEIVINQTYTDFIQTRSVEADGATRYYELTPGAIYSVTANRQKNKLKIETVSPRGNKMIENYSLLSAGKLSVTMRIESPQGTEIITMHRVYDRTILDIFSGGDTEMQ